MAGVTAEGNDLMDVRRKVGLGMNPDRISFIEVNLDHDYNIQHNGPPLFYSIRWHYGNQSATKGQLTLEALNKEIAFVLGLNEKWLADRNKKIADSDRAHRRERLKLAHKELAQVQKKVKELSKGEKHGKR